MSSRQGLTRIVGLTAGRRPAGLLALAPTVVGYALLAALVAWWAGRAFSDPISYDTGLAYSGGQVAWATGHPENLSTWISTPFLGLVMALISQTMSLSTASTLNVAVNLLFVLAVAVTFLRRMRGGLPAGWWWFAAFAILSFGPILSSVWWKQFNIFALFLAIFGFDELRHGGRHLGPALIGLSVSIKPLAILLPFVLLVRRETRRAGAEALAWIVGLNLAAQGVFAIRAHSVTPLTHVISIVGKLVSKSNGGNYQFACNPENFAPSSLLCREIGTNAITVQRIIVVIAIALFGLWAIDALRGKKATSWELFAFVCPLSAMVGVVAWSHYQIMLGPLFALLLVRFVQDGATRGTVIGLAVAFLLGTLDWQPYGTVVGALGHILFGKPQTLQQLDWIEGILQFAQYVLVITGVIWYAARRVPRGMMPAESART